jgi:hypothetical protein
LLFSLHTVCPLTTFSDANGGDMQYSNGQAQSILTILEIDHETNKQGAMSEYLHIKTHQF